MIVRATDASLHNRIANHPAVKPTLGYNEGPTDFTPLLDDPDNYVLLSDGSEAAAIFECSAPRVWQAHSMVLPTCRGWKAVDAGKAMLAWMFDEMNARLIWGQTPVDHKAAQMFNRLIGAKPEGRGVDAAGRAVTYFTVERV